ncbi:MAG: zinc ribbon domain-containing protein [Theionarchaea archaeon]|nr:zinc ribbon domain-containing protein [Theionarchaea archaeon]
MTETFSMDIEMPEFMKLVEAEAKKQILEEVTKKIRKQVAELVENSSREIIARKLDIFPSEVSSERIVKAQEAEQSGETEVNKDLEMKSSLAEEILYLPQKEAFNTLKLSLARGEIDEETFQELKALVEPVTTKVTVCPQCGKELEPTVNFCRFCGAKVK